MVKAFVVPRNGASRRGKVSARNLGDAVDEEESVAFLPRSDGMSE